MKPLLLTGPLLAGLCLTLAGCGSVPTIDARVAGSEAVRASALPSVLALQQKQWHHGAADCQSNSDAAIEVFRYDQSSYILRQNKCLSFEAPFIYVLFGDKKVLIVDTGATQSAADFPLYDTVQRLADQQSTGDGKSSRQWLVIHSHSHSDHYSGDAQFEGKANVTLVAPNQAAMRPFFGFEQWPLDEATIDLGGRKITVIGTPGHQEEAISVYDSQTRWLLTGDTFYPGYLMVKHWQDYQKSIARLLAFSNRHEVSAILGAHIEMTRQPGEYYPIGSTYQPSEAPLVLLPEHLRALDAQLGKLDAPTKIIFNEFIVAPMNALQKSLSNAARWATQ